MITKKPYLALWSMIFVFSITQWKMWTIFKCTQSKISHHSRYGSESLYWNQAGLLLFEQNRHVFNAKLCVQGLAQISTNFDGRQGVLPPYLRPNPIWTENTICGPFGCVVVPLRRINQPNSTSLWNFLALCNRYQRNYYPVP